jgi:hypothetical protein
MELAVARGGGEFIFLPLGHAEAPALREARGGERHERQSGSVGEKAAFHWIPIIVALGEADVAVTNPWLTSPHLSQVVAIVNRV